ncbi:MAG: hypothetical protein Q8927_06615 [Bacteroidota bacterium]|nr:hypothetical protein [Bacteroidota bacterium]MDP4215856.1 hypothetical protein [Bacteroidota bacterium]MDP4254002.1 hypothetical protein [Bacteroidota bacterium]MDP4258409.1 hypothetical protein [Bacteroidota bacterium]
MKKTIIAAWFVLALLSQGLAQDKGSGVKSPLPRHAWAFRSQEMGGLVSGEQGNYGQGYTINGVYKGPWFMGIGAGVDFYRYRTVPLFLSLEREWMQPGHDGWFTRLDVGVNVPWQSAPPTLYYPSGTVIGSHLLTAPYWDAEFGYKVFVNAHRNQAILISAGYSFKEVQNKETTVNYCPIAALCNTDPSFNTRRYTFYNRRLSLQVGYQF